MADEPREPQDEPEVTVQEEQAAGAAEAAPAAGAPAMDSVEMEQGKTFAILSYVLGFVGLPFFLVPLIQRSNAFALYHAKQCLMLWIAGVILSAVSGALMAVCIGLILLPLAAVFLVVLNVMGLINAINLRVKPLPLIGLWAEDWFKGIRKV